LNNLADNDSVVQLTQPGFLVENQIKINKEYEMKKTIRKKKNDKEEKPYPSDTIPTPMYVYKL